MLVLKAIWNCVKEFLFCIALLAGMLAVAGAGMFLIILAVTLIGNGIVAVIGEAAATAASNWFGENIQWLLGGLLAIACIAMIVAVVKDEYDKLKRLQKQKELEENGDGACD